MSTILKIIQNVKPLDCFNITVSKVITDFIYGIIIRINDSDKVEI